MSLVLSLYLKMLLTPRGNLVANTMRDTQPLQSAVSARADSKAAAHEEALRDHEKLKQPRQRNANATGPGCATTVHWSVPIGCDWSGFFVEFLGYLTALATTGPTLRASHQMECKDEILGSMQPDERQLLERAQLDPRDIQVQVQHAQVQHTAPRFR